MDRFQQILSSRGLFIYRFQGVNICHTEWEVSEAPEAGDIIWIHMQNPHGFSQKVGQNILLVLSTILIILLVLTSVAVAEFRDISSLLDGTPLEPLTATAKLPGFKLVPPIVLIILKTIVPIFINSTKIINL